MSADHLRRLWRANAFEAMPVRTDLHDLHVPFDQLVDGAGGSGPWEGRLRVALENRQRVAVLGASGEGKSSLMHFVLGPLVEGLAPLPVAVGLEAPDVVKDPAAFAEHFVGRVRQFVVRSLPKAVGKADLGGAQSARQRTRAVEVGVPAWLGTHLEVARELQSTSDATLTSAADHVETARALLDVVEAAGLVPVLLLDDTDKWLRSGEGSIDDELRDSFFRRVLRLLAEDLGCAAVVAVHPTYLDDDSYRAAPGSLSAGITLPRLPRVAALAEVLQHRDWIATGAEPNVSGAWSPEAVVALFERYSGPLTLRRTLTLAHASLGQATGEGAESIEPVHVDWADRELNG